MKSEKEIEDWLRETLEPSHPTKAQEHEVQSEVDKLVEERLSEFRPCGSRPPRTVHADSNPSSSLSPVTENTSSPGSTLFNDYSARTGSARKSRFIITAILAVGFAAGLIVIILTQTSKTASSPSASRTPFSAPSRESAVSPADSSGISKDTRPQTDSIPETETGISISDSNKTSMESPDPGKVSSQVDDEFLLEIEFPIPPLMESPRGSLMLSDPASAPPDAGPGREDRTETPHKYGEVSRSRTHEPPSPVDLESLDSPPKVLRRIPPVYPAKAFRRGIEGTVIINALISESGNVIRTKVLRPIKGDFGFEKACTEAIGEWRFQPPVKNGQNVKVWMPISIAFKRK